MESGKVFFINAADAVQRVKQLELDADFVLNYKGKTFEEVLSFVSRRIAREADMGSTRFYYWNPDTLLMCHLRRSLEERGFHVKHDEALGHMTIFWDNIPHWVGSLINVFDEILN